MSAEAKPILGSIALGGFLTQFKMFSFTRMFNLGLYAKTRKTSLGTDYKAVKDENGHWVAKKDIQEIEGAIQSFVKGYESLKKRGDMSVREWYKEQSPVRKMNLAKTTVQVAIFSIIYGLIKGIGDEEDERRFGWMTSDIFIGPTVTSFFDDPFPTISIVQDIAKNAMGGDLKELSRTFGAVRTIDNTIDNLTPSDDENTKEK